MYVCMYMRKWASNSKSLLGRIETAEKSNEIVENKQSSHTVCNEQEVKVLGLKWNQNTDKIQLD